MMFRRPFARHGKSSRRLHQRVSLAAARDRHARLASRRSLLVESLEDRTLLAVIALYADTDFVDVGNAISDEATNLTESLEALGHTVNTFDGTDEASFRDALSVNEILVIPELEAGDLAAALSPGAVKQIAEFVSHGGGLIIAGTTEDEGGADNDVAFLNEVFGFSIGDAGGASSDGTLDSTLSGAFGTAFAGGPATLDDNNDVAVIETDTLPPGSRSIYRDDSGDTTVALIPYSPDDAIGHIAYLGWDWYDSDPPHAAAQDGDWQGSSGALGRAVTAVTPTDVVVDANDGNSLFDERTDDGEQDAFVLRRVPANPQLVEIWVNLRVSRTWSLDTLRSITVKGSSDDDSLFLDESDGLLDLGATTDVRFLAGDGFDMLRLGNGSAGFEAVEVGATPGSGRSFLNEGFDVQVVEFQGIEPIESTVTVTNFEIRSISVLGVDPASLLDADNAINYTTVDIDPPIANGLVTIDNFEPIQFRNKTNLTIDAGAGDDVINLNGALVPTGLETITVNGQDPTASDKLIVNATAGVADGHILQPTAQGAGTIVDISGAMPPVAYTGIEDLDLVSQAVDVDALQIGGTAGDDTFQYTPGATLDEGSFRGTMDLLGATAAGPFTLPNVTFSGVSVFGTGIGINDDTATQGGADTVILNSTSDNDVFRITDDFVLLNINGENPLVAPFPPSLPLGNVFLVPGATSTTQMIVNAGDGDDTINLNGAAIAALSYDFNGGDPSGGSDVLNLNDPGGVAQIVTILPDPLDATQQDIAGFSASALPIDVTGMENIVYTGVGGNDTLTVNLGGAGTEARVSGGATLGGILYDRVTSDSLPVIDFADAAQLTNFILVGNPVSPPPPGVAAKEGTFVTGELTAALAYSTLFGPADTLIIEGADNVGVPDNYAIINRLAGPGLITVTDNNSGVVVDNTVVGPFAPGEVRFNTLAGDDVVNVNVGGGLGLDLIDTRIVYDGGTGGDLLNVIGVPAAAVVNQVYTPGPDPTSGRIDYGTAASPADLTGATLTGTMQIEFTNLQPVVDVVPAANLIVNGTNADNAINYSQGPNLGGFAANTGIVSVDNNETIEFANKATLILGGALSTSPTTAGSDTFNLNYQDPIGGTFAPTGLVGVPGIIVNGGDPTGSDKLIVNATAGGVVDGHILRPIAQGAGSIADIGAAMPPVAYTGIEDLDLVSQAVDGDALQIAGTLGNDTFQYTPGATLDEGSFRGTMDLLGATAAGPFTLPNVTFSGVSVFGTGIGINDDVPTQGGADTVILNGTSDNDVFQIADDIVLLNINGENPLVAPFPPSLPLGAVFLSPTSTTQMIVNAGDGDDTINLNNAAIAALSYDFNGGDPSGGSDVLNLNDPGVVQVVTILPDPLDATQQDIGGFSTLPIDVTGMENIVYTGVGGDDTLIVNIGGAGTEARVSGGATLGGILYDRVTSDSLPVIDFADTAAQLANFTLVGNPVVPPPPGVAAKEGTFVTGELAAALTYSTNFGSADTLIIEGADNVGVPDNYAIINTVAVPGLITVTDNNSGVVVNNTVLGPFAPGEVRFNTLAGDDVVNVNVGGGLGLDLIDTRIVYDGGTGGDLLNVVGAPATAVVNQVYTPGPDPTSGRIDYGTAASPADLTGATLTGTMQIEFTNLQPVVDVVPTANLIVNGTHEENDINYLTGSAAALGLVAIDGFETIEFANKTNLILNGLSGGDTINLDNANQPTALATITVNAAAGDDVVTLSNLPATTPATVNAGAGDDLVDGTLVTAAALTLNGNAGNDTLSGGGANDTLAGGTGDDLLIGNAGDNTYTEVAGQGFDTIGILGTPDDDVIDVNQTSATTLVSTVNGNTRNDTITTAGTVEEARIVADEGADLMRVTTADALFDDPGESLRMTVLGDRDSTRDRLIVVEDGTDDLVLYRKGQDDSNGTVTVGPANAEPFETVFENVERVQFLDEAGNPLNQNPGNAARLVVFKHDPFEYNDDRFVATLIGANQTVNVDPTIDPGGLVDPFGDGQNVPGDADWYRVEAEVTGTLDLQVFFEEIADIGARPGLPGNGNLDIELYDIDGTLVAGAGPAFGGNDGGGTNPELNVDGDTFFEDERIRVPAVEGQTYYLRVFGQSAEAINNYNITIINDAPPVAYDLELDDLPPGDDTLNDVPSNSDTGRSQFDNTTRDAQPEIVLRLDDAILLQDLPGNLVADTPPDEVIPIDFNASTDPANTDPGFRVAIFIEGDPQQPAVSPQQPIGFAQPGAEQGVYIFDFANANNGAGLTLTDGSHFISARVQMIDPADPTQTGFGLRSESLEIVVDTDEPPVFFGLVSAADTTQGLDSASDSGVIGDTPLAATFSDRITNDTTPTFFGTAEANAVVRVYAETNGTAGLQPVGADPDLLLGETVALPEDGTNQFPAGYWSLTTQLDLNNPALGFPRDGLRTIYSTGEDLAGNVTPAADADELEILIDTQGPRITSVFITSDPGYDLFDPKPSTDGPAPLVDSLSINVEDLPARVTQFLYDALAENAVDGDPAEEAGHYLLVGDHNGPIAIQSVAFNPVAPQNGLPATGTIVLSFVEPLPDDRFTLTISDAVVDPAGNALDGENNALEPQENPEFPTGDGQPGGDFVGRFTIDSRPEIGVWSDTSVYVDTNGNFVFDPEGKDNDNTNEDIAYVISAPGFQGFATDDVFAGNFGSGEGGADGFDKLAIYGRAVGGGFRFLLDTDNDGVPDTMIPMPLAANGLPVAGNFDGISANGDEVGVFDGATWFLGSAGGAPFTIVPTGISGLPIVGDFDGDGNDDLGTYNEVLDRFEFDLASNGFGGLDATIAFGFSGIREYPVAADMDQDGIDDIGLFVPDRGGAAPREAGEWYFLVSGQTPGTSTPGNVSTLDHGFEPQPFGNDLFAQYGDEFAVPVVGNFDPPVAAATAEPTATALYQNSANRYDVNADGIVTPLDVLHIFNDLNSRGGRTVAPTWTGGPGTYLDVNGDGLISPLDALIVINKLNRELAAPAAAAGEAVFATSIVNSQEVVSAELGATVSTPIVPQAAAVVATVELAPAPATRAESPAAAAAAQAAAATTGALDEAIANIAAEVAEAWLRDVAL